MFRIKLRGYILIGVVGIFALAIFASLIYLRTSLPKIRGTIQISGLDGSVEIIRDTDGVPHIFASTDHDAFFTLGYVHAQDRLWQMEFQRRVGAGR